jgi:hypothetical protein
VERGERESEWRGEAGQREATRREREEPTRRERRGKRHTTGEEREEPTGALTCI